MKPAAIFTVLLLTACTMLSAEEFRIPGIKQLESVLTFPGSDKTQKKSYEYDRTGKLLRVKTQAFKKDKPAGSADSVYKYDDKGQQVEVSELDGSGRLVMTQKITFDAKGRKITSASYELDGYEVYSSTYKYDDKDRLLEENHSTNTGDRTRTVYTYSADGNIVSDETRTIPDRQLLSKSAYKYDKKGRVKEKVTLILPFENGEGTKNIYTYNEKGHLLKDEYYNLSGKNEKLIYTVQYTYIFY